MDAQTTLIVTPDSLLQQWVDEISAHAPSLKVMVYRGWNKDQIHKTMSTQPGTTPVIVQPVPVRPVPVKTSKRKRVTSKKTETYKEAPAASPVDAIEVPDEVPSWSLEVNSYDIWITTYTVLAHELPVARAPLVRPRRETTTYANTERMRSPLVKIEWYRVIMDEVQMVGGGKTE